MTRPPVSPPAAPPPLPPVVDSAADSAADIADRAVALATALATALDDARRQADEGALIDLAGLEDSVARLCAAAEALPPGESRALLGRLGDLVAALDPLAAALTAQNARREDAMAAAIAGRDDPHTARQRAVAAYGRPAAPEST